MVRWLVNIRSTILVAGLAVALGSHAVAQISPGDLSTPHASLEGITNCTSCHQIGKAVVGTKCLDCHGEIKSRLEANKGYHGRVRNQSCVECHKEHHGRSFTLIRFDENSFDHASIGFALEGKHAVTKCRTCHNTRYVTAADVRRNQKLMEKGTFLGLGTACLDCHEDAHRGTLSKDCQRCHGAAAWKPASSFDHARTVFPLTGKHNAVKCERCHVKSGSETSTVKFRGLEFASCSNCHGDPHKGKFKQSCESCHSTAGWDIGASRHFDHSRTKFPLVGRHSTVACEACHRTAKDPASGRPVQRFTTLKFEQCADCHRDPHRGEFARFEGGGACESCHTVRGFAPSLFSHEKSRYPLRGKHQSVPCEKCHSSFADARSKKPLNFHVKEFSQCVHCHSDAHSGQFAARSDKGACESCHTVQGYVPSTFTVEQHGQSTFSLGGSHLAVQCSGCHRMATLNGVRQRQFAWKGNVRCSTCHENIHTKHFRVDTYGGCESCHVTTEWKWIRFNHDRTKFALTDKHAKTACAACHTTRDRSGKILTVRYADTPTRCIDCHQTPDGSTLKGS